MLARHTAASALVPGVSECTPHSFVEERVQSSALTVVYILVARGAIHVRIRDVLDRRRGVDMLGTEAAATLRVVTLGVGPAIATPLARLVLVVSWTVPPGFYLW